MTTIASLFDRLRAGSPLRHLARLGNWRQVRSFLLIGACNTLGTYILYLALLYFIPYWAAFTVCTAIGILISLAANGRFSFSARPNARATLVFSCYYGAQWFVGLQLLMFLHWLGVPVEIAPLIITVIMLPLNFIATRFSLTGRFLQP